MAKQLYEITWTARCLDYEFVQRHYKVFESIDEAVAYGKARQDEWNDGLPPEEKALDGFCFAFDAVYPVNSVDGYPIYVEGYQHVMPLIS